jgi:hypothetical protein
VIHEICAFDYSRDLRKYGGRALNMPFETTATVPIKIHDITRPHTITCHNDPGIVPFNPKRSYTNVLRDIMVAMLNSKPTQRSSEELLHTWTTQFFAAVEKIAVTKEMTVFDEAIKVMCDQNY